VKLAYRYGVDAVTVLMYRMLFSFPLFLALALWAGRGLGRLSAHDWRMVLMLGFTGYYLASFLDFLGLQYINASLERLILYLNSTIVLLLSRIFFRTPVSGRQWLALAISYLGVLVAFGHDVRLNGAEGIVGSLLVFGSAVSYAVYLIFSGTAVNRIGAMRLAGLATSVACVLCIGQFFVLRPVSAAAVPEPVIWLSLLNACLCTFLPVVLVMVAIRRIGAPMVAQAGMIGPLSTVLLSIVLLGEPFTAGVAVGTVLVIAGIWLLARWRT